MVGTLPICLHFTMSLPCLTTSIESFESQFAVNIPKDYEFADFFSKAKATQLPPSLPVGLCH